MTALLAWLAGSRIGRGLAMAGAVLLLVLGTRAKWRHDGASDARQDMKEADSDGAEEIRRRADAAARKSGDDRRSGLDRMRSDHAGNFVDDPGDQP